MCRLYLYWFSSKYEEMFSSHHHETHEFLTKNFLNFISLKKGRQEYNNGNHSNGGNTCLIAIDTRMEFTDPSINTFSFSFLLTMTGVKSNSPLLLLEIRTHSL